MKAKLISTIETRVSWETKMPITYESWVELGPEAEELCGSGHEERVVSYHPLEQVTLSVPATA